MKNKLACIKRVLPELRKLANPCLLCLHRCKADRAGGKKGFCRSTASPAVYSYSPHHGEEPPLSGTRGSGTIFFTHCNMKCVYCQNYAFSQESDFEEIETEELASRILELKRLGCHNINFVTPTHYVCRIVEALQIAIEKSLDLPIVYNTGGYDSPELIKLLEGIVDIYMPDMRYADDDMGKKYSSAPNYAENNRRIVKEMFRQTGIIELDEHGIAKRGVIVRLLMLPNNISGTVKTLEFLRNEVSKDIFLSVMSQYHPTYEAPGNPKLARRISKKEYDEVVQAVNESGFTNGWIQGYLTEPERFLGTRIKRGRFTWS